MNTRKPIAREKALAYLRVLQERGDAPHSIRSMAQSVGIAYVSMFKAVRLLVNSGYMISSRGKRSQFVRALPAAMPEVRQALPQTEPFDLLSRMRRDIVCGHFPDNATLPSLKQLAADYGVCYRTIRRLLSTLAGEKLIVPHGRRFRPVGVPHTSGTGSIALVSVGNAEGHLFGFTQLRSAMIHHLEMECASHGVQLRTYTLPFRSGRVHRCPELSTPPDLTAGDTLLGSIVLPLMMPQAFVSEVTSTLSSKGRPVALIDENGEAGALAEYGNQPFLRMFSVSSSERCGQLAARYLIGLGHRQVAFITAYDEERWAKNRYAGMVAHYRECGFTAQPVLHAIAQSGYTADATRRSNELFDIMQKPIGGFRSLARVPYEMSSAVAFDIQVRLGTFMIRAAVRHRLADSVLRLARDGTCSAIAASNDADALVCLDILKQHGYRVPEDISVLGFDDTQEASIRRLTSYNFNPQELMRTVVAWLLRPNGLNGRSPVTEIDGFVNQRDTVKRPAS